MNEKDVELVHWHVRKMYPNTPYAIEMGAGGIWVDIHNFLMFFIMKDHEVVDVITSHPKM